ncbi:MAG: hypothetical protein ACPG1A_13965 [Halioglobus sp.]
MKSSVINLRPLLAAALSLCLAGCSQWHWDMGMDLDELALPEPEEKLSLGEVLERFGPPLRISASDSGYVMAWEHWQVRENNVGLSLGAAGADFMSADWGELRAKGEFILLTFDRDHMLTAAEYDSWDKHGGGGQAVQPFMGFVSVTDTDGLLDRRQQHRWGMTMTKRLPEALNTQSDPHSGQAGIEQRGTPTAVGQQALEMQ